jgi:hypothetical protein
MSLKRWCCAFFALFGLVLPLAAQAPKGQFLKSPLVFEPNRGQADPAVKFVSHANGHSVFLRETDAVFAFSSPAITLRMKLVGQNPRPVIEGVDLQAGVTNYLVGNDRDEWQTAIPQFAKVKYGNVYPGIDLIYYGNQRQLEYDFVVAPHADPAPVQLEFEGADQITVGTEGDLILRTAGREIRQQRPIAFQMRKGVRQPVDVAFVVKGQRATFDLGQYDRSLPLVIDPTFIWATYMGGPAFDQGNDVAIDADGNVYVTGVTESSTAEPAGIFNPPAGQSLQAFVTKINAAGAIVFSTYFGGVAFDESHSVALDPAGNIYITGFTTSADFPTTANAFQKALNGTQDAYVLKLDKDGSTLIYSTYLGGNQTDRAFGIATDPGGNAIIAGNTLSRDFPTTNAFQSFFAGGLGEVFLTKLGPTGTPVFSTFLGGNGNDQAYDVGRDDDGNIVLTGFTTSQNFPTHKPLLANYRGGTDDVFITKFNESGSALVFSTYFGGSGSDNGVRLALDKDKKIYVTGYTSSVDFPLANPPQLFHGGFGNPNPTFDAFLVKLHADGQQADFSTFIGGEDHDSGVSVAVDKDGFIYLAGWTTSLRFYAINALGGFLRGLRDGFVMKIAPDASVVVFSSYLGGFGAEGATSVAVDSASNVYATGYTLSFDFPLSTPAMFQGATAGAQDGFIVKINTDDIKTSSPFTFNANGGFGVATAGQTANPIFGVGSVDIASGLSPSGLAIIDLRSQGTLVNEVSIPTSPLTHTGRFYTRTSATDDTALTIFNPGTEEVEIAYYFTTGENTSLFGSFKLPAKSQSSSLLSTQPYNFPQNLEGTTTVTTTGPVVMTALRVDTTGSVPVNTHVPIINPYEANKIPVTIPHFVDGGNWSTRYFLVNPTETTITGQIRLFKNGEPGQPGVPAVIASEVGVNSVFTYSIPPRAQYLLIGRGEAGDVTSGYADIVPTDDSFAPHAFATIHFVSTPALVPTVQAIPHGSNFNMYVESTGTFPGALAAAPALAIANSSDAPATVTLTLTALDGTPSGLSAEVSLPPRSHFAKFLKDIPGFETLPSPFFGVLRATTSQPGVTFSGYRARYNEQGAFLMIATGPLKDLGNMNPVIFPHVVDGGGYATQFVLIDVPGSGASGAVNFLDPSGKPLNVAIAP